MSTSKLLAALVAAAASAACGAPDADQLCAGKAPVEEHELAEAMEVDEAGGIAAVTVHEGDDGSSSREQALTAGSRTIFLNRHGGTFASGKSDSAKNLSSIVDDGCAVMPAYTQSDDDWDDVVSCVRERFSQFDVDIVDAEPTTGDYVEAVIGGEPQDLGLPEAIAGIAPMDTDGCSVLPKAIVFVFAANLPHRPRSVCEVAAQEIAHAYGLDHQYLCEDPMSYLHGCGEKKFRNIEASCGELEPRACMCGRDAQNSVQILADVLGEKPGVTIGAPTEDEGPPDVAVLSPDDGATLPGGTTVEIIASAEDDVSIGKVELVWEETGDVLPCPLRGTNASCSRIGDTYAWRLRVGIGERAFHVLAEDAFGASSRSETVRVVLQGDAVMASATY